MGRNRGACCDLCCRWQPNVCLFARIDECRALAQLGLQGCRSDFRRRQLPPNRWTNPLSDCAYIFQKIAYLCLPTFTSFNLAFGDFSSWQAWMKDMKRQAYADVDQLVPVSWPLPPWPMNMISRQPDAFLAPQGMWSFINCEYGFGIIFVSEASHSLTVV